MIKPVLLLACGLAVLLLWNRALEQESTTERDRRGRVQALTSAEERQALTIAAVRVEGPGARYLFARSSGQWIALDAFGAPVEEERLTALVRALTQAPALVQEEDPSDATRYGLDAPTTLRVSLCGTKARSDPQGDVHAAFDVGSRIPGREATYVRRVGTSEIWALESDLRSLLDARIDRALPPLLDPFVVPRSWPGWSEGLARVTIARRDGAVTVLERRPAEIDAPAAARGAKPWAWFVDPGPGEQRAPDVQAYAYTLFLERVPFAGLLDPAEKSALDLASPPAVVTLTTLEGRALPLALGAPLVDGRVPLWNPASQMLFALDPEVARLLAPGAELLVAEETSPWDAWLRR